MFRPLILITNDDGIASPGLAAAAAALDPLGELLIVAPASQQTSMGRSRSWKASQDGQIRQQKVIYGDKSWDGFSVNATPAMVVEHALQEIAPRKVTLAVSGINYGENIGTCITVSGTIGAAMEAAERGVAALAVSLETGIAQYYHYDKMVDFSAAMHFVHFFAAHLLGKAWPPDVDVLKIDIPISATPQSSWAAARQDRISYYTPRLSGRANLYEDDCHIEYIVAKGQFNQTDSDAAMMARGWVSVTPLSLDHTSRINLAEVQNLVNSQPEE